MDKLQMAHDYAMQLVASPDYDDDMSLVDFVAHVWQYADAMQAEADKRNKAEAEQKRKEIREMLNAPNTFVEREGQHFDDLTPTWDQGPNVLTAEDAEKYKNMIKREFDLYNNPQPKIEKRKSMHAEKSEWQPDWSRAPEGYNYFCVGSYSGNGYFCHIEPIIYKDHHWFTGEGVIQVMNHGYQGNWKDSLRKRPQ